MKKAPALFGLSFIVMCFAYAYGTFHPSSRIVAGPLTLLAIACLIGSVISMAWEMHRLRQRSRQRDRQYRYDMREGELQLAQAIVEEGLTGDRQRKAAALMHIEQAKLRIERAKLDSLRYKPSKRKKE